MDSYIICATPRTGSTLLCDLLSSAGTLGSPDSFFMQDLDPVWRNRWGLPQRDGRSDRDYGRAYLSAAIRAGRGTAAIFGLRLMQKDLGALSAMIGSLFPGAQSDKDRFQAAFGEVLYVHLTRRDKLAQAVSLVRAGQTGLWHAAPDGRELERLSPPQAPRYDFDLIAQQLKELERHDAAWLAWFEDQGIAPLKVEYECLAAEPADAVGRICAELGVPAPDPARMKPGVAKLADALSLDWMRRFRAEAGRQS